MLILYKLIKNISVIETYHYCSNDVSFILLNFMRTKSHIFCGYGLKTSFIGPLGDLER